MADLSWIKLFIGIFDDEKIKFIDTLEMHNLFICIWIKLLVQAGKTNKNGKICMEQNIPYALDMLAIIFNRSEQEIKAALDVFEKLRMIKIDKKGIITITNWEKHQNVEGMARVRELTRNRVKKCREKKKKENFFSDNCNATVTNQCNVTEKSVDEHVTVQNRKEEKEKRKDKKIEDREKEKREEERAYYNKVREKIYSKSNINL